MIFATNLGWRLAARSPRVMSPPGAFFALAQAAGDGIAGAWHTTIAAGSAAVGLAAVTCILLLLAALGLASAVLLCLRARYAWAEHPFDGRSPDVPGDRAGGGFLHVPSGFSAVRNSFRGAP